MTRVGARDKKPAITCEAAACLAKTGQSQLCKLLKSTREHGKNNHQCPTTNTNQIHSVLHPQHDQSHLFELKIRTVARREIQTTLRITNQKVLFCT